MLKVGFGTDLHRIVPDDNGLRLGGITVPAEYRCIAHSDGDVLLHALIDALLGVCGLGDIGDYFPESKVRKGEDSAVLLAEALTMTARAGMRIINIDCVIDLEAVKLREWKKSIARNMASLLGLAEGMVSVKAKTAEGLGPVGENRAVAAQVVVLAEFDE